MSRSYCLSTPTDEITTLHQIYQCHGSVVLNNCRLTTIPVHCYCTVLVGVRSLTSSPTLASSYIASQADIHLGILLMVRKLAML
jgi:hypothetical protein